MASVRTPDPNPGWLSEIALDETRARVPILYVEAVPVRIDALGQVQHVGILLRGSATTGELSRTLVAGRVMHGESVREALLRNLEKDLGPTAFPQLPASTVPFTVAEYFPLPGVTPLHDPRQHTAGRARLCRAGQWRVQPASGRARAHLAHPRGGHEPGGPGRSRRWPGHPAEAGARGGRRAADLTVAAVSEPSSLEVREATPDDLDVVLALQREDCSTPSASRTTSQRTSARPSP